MLVIATLTDKMTLLRSSVRQIRQYPTRSVLCRDTHFQSKTASSVTRSLRHLSALFLRTFPSILMRVMAVSFLATSTTIRQISDRFMLPMITNRAPDCAILPQNPSKIVNICSRPAMVLEAKNPQIGAKLSVRASSHQIKIRKVKKLSGKAIYP